MSRKSGALTLPKLLILDLDDTLVPSTKAYRHALDSIGITAKNKNYLHARETIKKRLGHAHVSSHNRILYFKTMLDIEENYSPQATLTLSENYEKALLEYIRAAFLKLKRKKTLEKLSRKTPIVLITNENTRTQLMKVNTIDPKNELFAQIYTSEEFGKEKPDPAMLKHVLKTWNRSPRDCLVVGDDLARDLLPAQALGCATIWSHEFIRPSSLKKIKAHPLSIINNFDELLALLGCA